MDIDNCVISFHFITMAFPLTRFFYSERKKAGEERQENNLPSMNFAIFFLLSCGIIKNEQTKTRGILNHPNGTQEK